MVRSLVLAAALGCAAAPPAAGQEGARPNVLFAIADDWSWGHASVLGTPWVETPAFDRVAREGALFARAYTPNPKCAPSRAVVLTGRDPWRLGDAMNHVCPFPPRFRGWMEALAAQGYATGYTGKGWGPGRARTADGAPRRLTGPRFAERLEERRPGIAGVDYAASFDAFLDATDEGAPWAFWYGALEPHRGYDEGGGIRAGGDPASIERVPAYWPDDEVVRGDVLDYAREVEWFDAHLGRMLARLEADGALDGTLVVVTSDHGMPFPRCKGQLYEHGTHVPLAMRWPRGGVEPGTRVDALVSLADVAPTVLEAARVDDPDGLLEPMSGRSLLALLGGAPDPPWRDALLFAKERHDVGRPGDAGYPIRGILRGDHLLLVNHAPDRWPAGNPETGYLNCDGGATKSRILALRREGGDPRPWELCFGKRPAVELYDVARDPDCVVDLAGREEHADRRDALRAELEAALAAAGDPRALGDAAVFESIEYTDARMRDYHARFLAGEAPYAGWVRRGDYEPREGEDR